MTLIILVGNSTPWWSWKRDTFISNVIFFPCCSGKLLWWGKYYLAGICTLYYTYMSSERTETDTTDEPECCIVMWPPVRFHDRGLNRHVTFRQVLWHRLLFLYRVRYRHIICHLTVFNMCWTWIWFYFKLDGFRAYCAIKCIHYMNK